MITEATVRATKLWPELLPNTGMLNVLAGATSVPQLNMQQFLKTGLWGRLHEMLQPNSALNMKLTSDEVVLNIPTVALRNGLFETFDMESTNYLDFTYNNPGLIPVAHSWYHSMWVYKPTIAQKLARRQSLTPQEQAIATELGIADTVQKGVLPLPLDYQIEREYQVIQESVRTRNLGLIAGQETVLDTIYANASADEAIVLSGFSCTPDFLPADTVLQFDRDKDIGLVSSLWTTPLLLANNYRVFIPALHEIVLKATSTAGIGAGLFSIRYIIRRIRLSNTLKARWGVIPPEELPGDVYKKVLAGIL